MRSNEDAARLLDALADVYRGVGDRNRRLAYERAAASVRAAPVRLAPGTSAEELDRLPHVGPAIARTLERYLAEGRAPELEDLRRGFPRDFGAFLRIRGVGPRLALRFHREIGVETLDDLAEAARIGRLRGLDGVGPALEERVVREAERLKREGAHRVLLARALRASEEVASALERAGLAPTAVAGEARRGVALVEEGVVVVAGDAARAKDAVASLPLAQVAEEGGDLLVRTPGGIVVRVRPAPAEAFGATLALATGDAAHVAALRGLAGRNGMVLDGALRTAEGAVVPAASEAAFFERLGLPPIPAEAREGAEPVEAAGRGGTPGLLELADLRGDLHMHTTATDGAASLEEMVDAAASLGHHYVAVTDHAKGLPVPEGLDEETLLARLAAVAQVRMPIPVLVGSEVNILDEGRLSLDEPTLEALDLVVASVHSGLREERPVITRRVVDALSTGLVDVLGHPTGRRLPARPESAIDFERVFDEAERQKTAVEINGSPERMDLPDRIARRAKERGLRFALDSDAHHPRELNNLRYATIVARRAALEPSDVVTALPYDAFSAWRKRRRSRG